MTAAATVSTPAVDPGAYRQVFGLLPTGVVAVTGLDINGKPAGLIVGTFQSLSLAPALVTFCVDKSSSTWPVLRSLGRFTANILSTEQLSVCKALSRKGEDKFQGVDYQDSVLGTPRILNSTAWIDCEVLSEVVAGDHYMIVGAVKAMEAGTGDALVFRGGKFGEYHQWPVPAPTGAEKSPAMTIQHPDNEGRGNP